MKYLIILGWFIILNWSCGDSNSTIQTILDSGSRDFHQILRNPKHEIQIIYGEISGDSIIHHRYNVNPNKYFYPASAIKMPVALAAVIRAQELNIPLNSRILIDSTTIYPRSIGSDTSTDQAITLQELISRIFCLSDNMAYNVLYGWLGQDYIHELYEEAGLVTRNTHQLGESAFSFSPLSNRYTRRAFVILPKGDTLKFEEREQRFQAVLPVEGQLKGKGHVDSLSTLVNAPFDFSRKNFMPLEDLLKVLELTVRPNLFHGKNSFIITEMNRVVLDSVMSMRPKDMGHPYDTLPDNYVKFLLYGNDPVGHIPDHIKIRNKVGWAYGYLLDVAYIEDTRNDIEFFLAAVIHVNENEVYNDGIYEYEKIGLPFLDELGDLVYQHELNKK